VLSPSFADTADRVFCAAFSWRVGAHSGRSALEQSALTSDVASAATSRQSAGMSDETVHEWLDAAWVRVDADARVSKDSQRAVPELIRLLGTVNPDDRHEADEVVIQWALGTDTARQFDALALIDHFKIVSALPALRDLARRFEAADGPSAPYDWAKINRCHRTAVRDLTAVLRRPATGVVDRTAFRDVRVAPECRRFRMVNVGIFLAIISYPLGRAVRSLRCVSVTGGRLWSRSGRVDPEVDAAPVPSGLRGARRRRRPAQPGLFS